MKTIFQPAILLMNHLRYPKKFILLGIIAAIVIAILTFQLVKQSFSIMDFSSKELLGVEYNNPLIKLMKNLQEYRYLEIETSLGKVSLKSNLDTIRDEIDTTIALIDVKEAQLGLLLGTTVKWNEIKRSWAAIKNVNTKTPQNNNSAMISGIIANIQNLMILSCDNSNLTLDPDIDTYYSMDSYCTKLPKFSEEIATIRDVGIQALATKSLTDQGHEQLIINKTLMDKFNKVGIKTNLDKVLANRPALAPTFDPLIKSVITETNMISRLTDAILSNQFATIPPAQFDDSSNLLITETYKLYSETGSTLYKLIKERVKTIQYSAYTNLAIAIIGLATLIYLFTGIYKSVIASIKTLVKGSEKLATGDLAAPVILETQDELQHVAASFNAMRNSLSKMINGLEKLIRNVKVVTKNIQHESIEITSDNNDLAKRTGQQATFLEETAASIEELTTTVKQNAENAKQANQLAQMASNVAIKGGIVVGEVVQTMTTINESSNKVADIISVIDNIAFQTNILALNAAVEAARAGEQGRGFAVVATEVRNLAQRTSTAAKEINALINQSVENVSSGTKLVDQAGKTMEEIVKAVNHVTEIMAEIANASLEQSNGIEQVNEAVNQIDHVTQQNLMMVEKAAKLAKSMKNQAIHMDKLVNQFKLTATQQAPKITEILENIIESKETTEEDQKPSKERSHFSNKNKNIWEEF